MKHTTEHALKERTPSDILDAQIASLQGNAVLQEATQHTPEHVVLLNSHQQILYANTSYLAMAKNKGSGKVYGARFGEHLGCIHATSGEGACGTAAACQTCGAVNAVVKSLNGHVAMQRCTIPIETEQDPLQLIIFTIPVRIDESVYILAAFVDDNKVIEHPHTLAEHTFAVQRLAARIERS